MVLFAAGNALQVYAIDRTRGAVRALVRLAPNEVLVRRGGSEVVIPADEVEVGDTVVVRPGERLAVDGRVVEGSSAVDEAPVTGESVPVEKGAGDAVYSGSLNGQGGLLVEATKRAGDSTLQRIARLVEEAQANKAPAEQFVDRFSRVYTPVVVAAAVVLAVVPPLLGGGFGEWFYRALALLIIACPCALVISTPVTVVSGIGAASRRGILVKGGAALEAAGRLKALAFDKTGTLTEGRPIVSRTVALNGKGEAEVLSLAASLERRSEHPLAHAILTAAGGAELRPVSGFRSVAGRGAEGEVDGKRYLIGSPRLFAERGIALDGADEALEAVERAGETPVVLGDADGPLAVFGLADSLRPDAKATVEALRESGVGGARDAHGRRRGARPARGRRAGHRLQGEAPARAEDRGGARARSKARGRGHGRRRRQRRPGPGRLLGRLRDGGCGNGRCLRDGRRGADAGRSAQAGRGSRLSRAAERIIKQNVVVSIAIKGLFVLLAPFGLVALWLAVLADMGTSIAVTLNGLRLFRRGIR